MSIMPGNPHIWQYGQQLFGWCLLWGGLTFAPLSLAAERIDLLVGDSTWTVTMTDVVTWVSSGTPQGSLTPLAQVLAPPALAELRHWLTQPVPLPPAQRQRLLHTEAGSQVFQRLGQFLVPPDPQALKQAFTLVLHHQKPLTALQVLQAFPAETVTIDALAVANVLVSLQTHQQQTTQAVNSLPLLPPTGVPRKLTGTSWREHLLIFTPPERPQRALKVNLLIPNGVQRVPVVLLSHGIGQTGRSLLYVGEYLASQGMAAAVITHPAQSGLSEFSERPHDIRHVLDYLAQQPQAQRLHRERVGVLGHSFGGYTALVAAGAQPQRSELARQCQQELAVLNLSLVLLQCRALELNPWPVVHPDPRIRAVVAINPAIGGILGASGLSSVRVPVLLIGGGNDWVTPVLSEQIQPFRGLRGQPHYLVILPTAQHIDGLDELRQFSPPRLPPIPQALAHLSWEFFRTHLLPHSVPLTPERLRQPTLPLRVQTAPP